MPNGGYPRACELYPTDGDVIVQLDFRSVRLLTRIAGTSEYSLTATLSQSQVVAMLFHLLYWGCGYQAGAAQPISSFDGAPIVPDHNTRGVRYVY